MRRPGSPGTHKELPRSHASPSRPNRRGGSELLTRCRLREIPLIISTHSFPVRLEIRMKPFVTQKPAIVEPV